MKINSLSLNNQNKNRDINKNNSTNPNFKGLIDVPGMMMNGIEKGGFATSFLIQDTMGMTAPRTGEGLIRGIDKERVNATFNVIKAKMLFQEPKQEDKEKSIKFKELNFKEGLEVAIREGLSGPLMMATPVVVLLLGKKFVGKSTFTNSGMINRLGNKLTNIVKNGNNNSIKSLKTDFYKQNITDLVQATTNAADKTAEAQFIDKALKSVEKLDLIAEKASKSKGKYKKALNKLEERENKKLLDLFNDFHKTNSSDLDMVNRVRFDGEVYSTDKMISGMRAYAEDAFKGKNISDITSDYTKNLKTSSIIKRTATNITATLSTIGSLSIVPMIYKLVNPVPPGAIANGTQGTANSEVKTAEVSNEQKTNNKTSQVSFKGKWDKLAKNLEFNGNQFTPALMTSLSVCGLMGPRTLTAAKRAPEDPVTKKKDYSEIPEILVRDITSTLAVTFGVPTLSKAIISTYENASGFVLQNKPEKPMSKVKSFVDKLNPLSAYSYYGISDLDQIYGNINTPEKLTNMTNFVDKNGGNIAKVLNTVKETKEVFSNHGLNINELAKQKDKKAANQIIMEKMAESKEFTQKLIDAIKPAKEGAANNILKRARSLNSIVSAAATFILVPAILGIVLPKIVYSMTENNRKKKANLNNAQPVNTVSAQNTETAKPAETVQDAKKAIDYSKLRRQENPTFKQMKHS